VLNQAESAGAETGESLLTLAPGQRRLPGLGMGPGVANRLGSRYAAEAVTSGLTGQPHPGHQPRSRPVQKDTADGRNETGFKFSAARGG
jgi:hypothetical protein